MRVVPLARGMLSIFKSCRSEATFSALSSGGSEPSDNRIAFIVISGLASRKLIARISSIAPSVSIIIVWFILTGSG